MNDQTLSRPRAVTGRRAALAVATLAVAGGIVAGGGTPAFADTGKCREPQADICVFFSPAPVQGATVYGQLLPAPVDDATVIVKQCRSTSDPNCVVIAATHNEATTKKPVATGHFYQACASYTLLSTGQRFVNVCTDFAGVPIP